MVDFDTRINELIDTAIARGKAVRNSFNYYSIFKKNLVLTKLSAKRQSDAYFSGYIEGIHDANKLFETYERDARGEQEGVPDEPVEYVDDMYDDADALASAGHGTDEDYGYYGEEY
tara:strand:- start:1174 stop:1521 length:348 start_codon:yes stop_codon:yes gene_type:complete